MAELMLKNGESEDSTKKSLRKDRKNDRKLEKDAGAGSKKKSSSPDKSEKTPVRRGSSVDKHDKNDKPSHASSRTLDSGNLNEKSKNSDSAGPSPSQKNSQNAEPDITLVDIMTVMQSMRASQEKTDKRLDDLSSKVNDWYEEYDEDELLRDDGQGEGEPDPENYIDGQNQDNEAEIDNDNSVVPDVGDANNNEPPAKKQRTDNNGDQAATDSNAAGTSLFKGLGDKFKIKEKLDPPVDDELAEVVNGLFANGIPDVKLSELLKEINRPENCKMLTNTRVNKLIWDLLSERTRGEENRTQYKQGLVVKAAILITKLLDKLNTYRKDKENFPDEVMELGADALGLLAHHHRSSNLARRTLHKPDLSPEYFHLCSPSVPYTEFLYGDNVTKEVSDIDSVNKVGKKVGRGNEIWGRGTSAYGRFPRRFGRSRVRRGGRIRGTSTSGRPPRGRGQYSNNFGYQAQGHYENVYPYNPNQYDGQWQYSQPQEIPKNLRRGLKRRRP